MPRPLIEGKATELGPWREIGGAHLCADLDGTNEVMVRCENTTTGSSGWKCVSPDFNYGAVELSEEQKIEHILAVNLARRGLVKEQGEELVQ